MRCEEGEGREGEREGEEGEDLDGGLVHRGDEAGVSIDRDGTEDIFRQRVIE